MADRFESHESSLNSPADDGFSITPGVSEFTTTARAIYVGGAGDVELISLKGTTLIFKSVPAGTIIPMRSTHVLATSTTATFLIGVI